MNNQKKIQRFMCTVMILVMTTCIISVCAEGNGYIAPITSFDTNGISNALIVSDEEIYLCGLAPNGSWLRKTNINNDVVSEWTFTDVVGIQPVIQCFTVVGGSILVGLVDSYTQKAAVAILHEDKIQYVYLPDTMKVLLSSMRADDTGLSIISFTDTKAQREIYHTHVSPEGITDSMLVGQSTTDDVVIADSFSYAAGDGFYLLRMSKIEGVINNCNRELIACDTDGQHKWNILLPEDLVINGMDFDESNIYLYGFQRHEDYNRAYMACYDFTGKFIWSQTYDDIGTIEYLTANDEIICLVGKSQRVSEQWIVYRYEKEGKQVYAQNLALPEAYKSYWSLDNSHIDLIRNIEDETWVWHIDW